MSDRVTEKNVVERFFKEFVTPEEVLTLEGVHKAVWLKRPQELTQLSEATENVPAIPE